MRGCRERRGTSMGDGKTHATDHNVMKTMIRSMNGKITQGSRWHGSTIKKVI